MTKRYLLYQDKYDPFIDFLKGYMILCVLFTHSCQAWAPLREYSLYYLWGCAPTGCFILISAMHTFRYGLKEANIALRKHIWKVLIPFLVIQVFIVIAHILFKTTIYDKETIINLLQSGGFGVGSYFPWVYIQFVILMMVLMPIIKILHSKKRLFIFFLSLSVLIEVSCSLLHFDDGWYRVCVLRFFFLIYWGIVLDTEGVFLSKKRILLSLIGLFFIVMFTYGKVNLEPIFFNSSWRTYHWVCYPYLAYLLIYAVYFLFTKAKDGLFSRSIIRIGKSSYGIFLFQSVWYMMLPIPRKDEPLRIGIYIIASMIICTISGIALKEKVLDVMYRAFDKQC